ncbi:hypothetical protein HDU96_001661, partial [Phlyctochytrium bullatum]
MSTDTKAVEATPIEVKTDAKVAEVEQIPATVETTAVVMDNGLDATEEGIKAEKPHFGKRSKNTVLIHLLIWVLLTAYMIAFIIKGQGKTGYEFGILIYAVISVRLLAKHVSPSHYIYAPLGKVYNSSIGAGLGKVSDNLKTIILGVAFIIAIILTAVASPTTNVGTIPQRLQSIAGLFVMLLVLYATSTNRRAIPWKTVVVGLILQFLLALFIMRTQIGVNIFRFISKTITDFLGLSAEGLKFIFGNDVVEIRNFAVAVLPAIVFFCSVVSIVYYWGAMQYMVGKVAWIMVRLMDTSGSESVVAAASPFVGQGESALLVRPFVEYMTTSELHSTMTSGFATIAGSVLLAFVQFTGNSPAATATLLTACVMSVPCSLLISKMRYPETEQSLTKGEVKIPQDEEKDVNFLHAAGNGAATGVQLILLISGSLLAIVSLYALANFLTGFLFDMVGIENWVDGGRVSIGFLLSYPFTVAAICVGITPSQARKAGEFIADKIVVNEFYAYASLNVYAFDPTPLADGSFAIKPNTFDERTVRLLSFALCGFANFASIGIQIGCLGAMAPSRKKDLATLALSAMIC